jgi:tetratricopeptide (TPR) repeat protein
MTKENFLFATIGLLLGVIVGFTVANTVNQRASVRPASIAENGVQSEQLPPDHPAMPSNAVGGQQQGGALPEVQQAIQRAKNEPNNFDAQMEAASLFTQINRYDDALQYLTQANKIKPDSYETIVALGNTNFDAHNYDAAQKWYEQALARKTDDINVRTDYGLSLMFGEKADNDRAIAEFQKSLQKDPNHQPTLQNMVVALSQKGDAAGAESMLHKLEQINPQNPALPQLKARLQGVKGGSAVPGQAMK